jgi:acyl-homoserine-lactone acylase
VASPIHSRKFSAGFLVAAVLFFGGWLAVRGTALPLVPPARSPRQQRPSSSQKPPHFIGPPVHLQAEILWDTWGVPHIYAHDEPSAFRAFGWAQMTDHADLMLTLVARARGVAAEYFGPKELPSDRTVATIDVTALAHRQYALQSPQFRRDLQSFAGGINEFAERNPGTIPPSLRPLLPVTPLDVLAIGIRINYAFLSLSSPCARYLTPGVTPAAPPLTGSNGWAIGPAHSADGNAMLLANPHLPWWGEFTWQEAQIDIPGVYDAYGATLVGLPVLGVAFNQHLGWTHTVNTINACAVYDLTPDGDGYLYDGRKRRFETRTATLRVRQPDGRFTTETLNLRRSIQGPVVADKDHLYALRMSGFQVGSFAGSLEEWWQMGRAQNLAEFETALRRMQLSMFNVIYADDRGNILLLFNGLSPRFPEGTADFWAHPVPGDTSATLFTSLLPYSDLPKAINPSSGWVQNSNSAPWYMTRPILDPNRFPAYISHGFASQFGWPSLREQRGLQMLTSTLKFTYDQLIHDKYSTRSGLADRILPDLLAAVRASKNAKAKQAATVLASWDRHFDAGSSGAVLFAEWAHDVFKQQAFFARGFDVHHELDTPNGIRNPAAAVRALAAAAAAVEKEYGRLDVPWGDVFRFHLGAVNMPANGGTSGFGVFRVINYVPDGDHRFRANGGDSFIAAVEFSHPLKARVLLDYGESTDPASPHFGDQLRLAAAKQMRPAWLDRDQILRHLESRTTFTNTSVSTEPASAASPH